MNAAQPVAEVEQVAQQAGAGRADLVHRRAQAGALRRRALQAVLIRVEWVRDILYA